MLFEYSRKIDNIILRHETRYDVLNDFTQAHLALLKPISAQSTQSAAKSDAISNQSSTHNFVKDRSIYKRDLIDSQMCLVCNGKLSGQDSSPREQSSSPSKADLPIFTSSSSSGSGAKTRNKELRPELLASNLCMARGLSLKRKLIEHVAGYDSLAASLEKSNSAETNAMYLPLHDYGAYSQGSGDSQESSRGGEEGQGRRHTGNECLADVALAEQIAIEKVLEKQLILRLKNNLKRCVTDVRKLEDAYSRRLGKGKDPSSSSSCSKKRKKM